MLEGGLQKEPNEIRSSWCFGDVSDVDCYHVLTMVLGQEVSYVWHKETDLSGYDCVFLPGGFRRGLLEVRGHCAGFSPVMEAVGILAGREGW